MIHSTFGIADLFGGDSGTAAKAGQIFNMIDAATQNRTISTVLAGQFYLVSCLSCFHSFAVLLQLLHPGYYCIYCQCADDRLGTTVCVCVFKLNNISVSSDYKRYRDTTGRTMTELKKKLFRLTSLFIKFNGSANAVLVVLSIVASFNAIIPYYQPACLAFFVRNCARVLVTRLIHE